MRILIVDDIEDSRMLLKKILESAGYSVTTAVNGRDGMDKARSSFPDLIVSDILMPELDGFGFCREIKKDDRLHKIPFIFCTATYTDQKDENLAAALGASRFIVKPVDSKVFLELIKDVIKENEHDIAQKPEQLISAEELLSVHESRILNKLNEKHQDLEIKHADLLRKEAELVVSEEKYHSIFNNVNDAIFIHGIEGMAILDVNQKMCDMYGYTNEEALKLTVLDLSAGDPEQTMKTAQLYIEKTVDEGPQIFEWQCKNKAGSVFWVEVNLKLIKLNGQDRIIAVIRDISPGKEAREKLLLVQASIDSTNESIFWIDKDANFINVNKSACNDLGYSKEEMLSMKVTDIAPQFPLEKWPANWIELKKRGSIVFETRHRHKNGKENPVEVKLNYIEFGGKEYNFAFARDITERKQSEEAFRESEARFRAIFENSPVGISIANSKGEIVDSNPAFQNMLGYTKDDLTRRFSEVTYPEDIPQNMHFFQEMLDGARDHYMMEKRYYHKDGSIVWANVIVTVIRDRNGEFKYNFAIIEDISDRKKLEDQLRHAQKMEAVGQLAGGVAHDFNNILTAIIGYGSVLKLKLKGDEHLQHNINQILAITERGAGLTQSLLAFSRKQNISLKPTKPNDIIERISRLIPRLIGEEIEFRKKLCDQNMTVMADSSQLEQVLMNLAGNARDAMSDGGVLTIETEQVNLELDFVKMHGFGSPGQYALISVSDTGIGIDAETIDKIFEPFFTTKEVGEGTGLGLSLVYGIIKQHNGYVNVYSEPDRGTIFKIHLPLIDDAKAEKKLLEDDYMIGGAETILLAEDEVDVRGAIKEILKEYGFSVIEAVDGKDAIDKYSENKDNINLLLMDVVMPGMNGKEAYDEIKKITPDIKAIFTSGYTSKTVHDKGVFQEGVHYISKPVIPKTLLKKIREVMDES